jgi:hypothetical protein
MIQLSAKSYGYWLLVYWQGQCPAHDIALSHAAGILWSDVLKNPSQSDSSLPVNLVFPDPLPTTGCIGLYFGGGPLLEGKAKMSADWCGIFAENLNSREDTPDG